MDNSTQLLLQEILADVRACRRDIVELKATNAEKRGERRVFLWLAGAVSASVSLAVSLWK